MSDNFLNKERKSFGYAFKGIWSGIMSETHIRIHLVMMILVVLFGWILNISFYEWLICFLCFGVVIGAELFNTAVELLVDLISPQKQPVAGKIKDIAAGAVLVTAVFAAIIGLLIFVPKLYALMI